MSQYYVEVELISKKNLGLEFFTAKFELFIENYNKFIIKKKHEQNLSYS